MASDSRAWGGQDGTQRREAVRSRARERERATHPHYSKSLRSEREMDVAQMSAFLLMFPHLSWKLARWGFLIIALQMTLTFRDAACYWLGADQGLTLL